MLQTTDFMDKVMTTDTMMQMMYAYRLHPGFTYHFNNYGFFELTIDSNTGSLTFSNVMSAARSPDYLFLHGFFLEFAWGFLALLLLLSNRLFRGNYLVS